MNWIEQVVEEFGQRIGLPHLALDEERSLHLDSADGTSLGFYRIDDAAKPEVVVYRSMPANYLSPAQYRMALQAANFRANRPWPFQAACDQRELFMAVRIPERAFMLSSLEKALDDLGKSLEKISSVP